ncbi:ribonuclease HI family protein [Nocardioides campestrisoli]|uniref:ribonuclease HI family protein n=1 Tax=Nocardioides campestrisoli TaxID=2736757 RepID=UPI00163D3E3E|nr:ribonuclease HI family protein [Nocardioides campestrisoli]
MTIIAAADGSALGNPGPAGWAWYVDDQHWACGGWPRGTNNMGELMGVLDLLQQTAHLDEELHVICDSTYVINSITKWMAGWKRKGWKKKDGKPVLNVELMKAIDEAMAGRAVTFEWVKGHAGHVLNEQADRLANGAALAWQGGAAPDPGPGYAGATTTHPSAAPGQVEEEPDLFSGLTAQPDHVPTPEEEVIDLERSLLTDRVRSDPAAVAALLHPQWQEIGASGRLWSREELLAEIGPIPETTLDVVTVEQVEPDQVLLVWRSVGSDQVALRSSWWTRRHGRWVQRFHHATPERA